MNFGNAVKCKLHKLMININWKHKAEEKQKFVI